MQHPDKPSQRDYMEAVLAKLLQHGWVDGYGFNDQTERYVFHWTEKGKERARWMREISSELHLGAKGTEALIALCLLPGDGQ